MHAIECISLDQPKTLPHNAIHHIICQTLYQLESVYCHNYYQVQLSNIIPLTWTCICQPFIISMSTKEPFQQLTFFSSAIFLNELQTCIVDLSFFGNKIFHSFSRWRAESANHCLQLNLEY